MNKNHQATWEAEWIKAHPHLYRDEFHQDLVIQRIAARLTLRSSAVLSALKTSALTGKDSAVASYLRGENFLDPKFPGRLFRMTEMIITAPNPYSKASQEEMNFHDDHIAIIVEGMADDCDYTEQYSRSLFKNPYHIEILDTLFREFDISKDQTVYYCEEPSIASMHLAAQFAGQTFSIELHFHNPND